MGVFGYTDLDGYYTMTNAYLGTRACSPAADGTVTKLSAYFTNYSEGDSVICGVYDASDNSLVGITDSVDGPQDAGWVDFPVSVPFDVYSTSSYYLLALTPSGSSVTLYRSVPGGSEDRPQKLTANLTEPPATCALATGTTSYCITCTYSEATILSLAGTIAGVSSISGAIGANPVSVLGLAGTVAGVSEITGAIGANPVSVLGLSGLIEGVSGITGAIGENPVSVLGLVGVIAGVSNITGAIGANPVTVLGLAGAIAGVSSITGALAYWIDVTSVYPPDRAGSYNADLYWDEVNDAWTATRFAGQGSYTVYVLAVGEKGELYFRVV